jgi:hypothetical protein
MKPRFALYLGATLAVITTSSLEAQPVTYTNSTNFFNAIASYASFTTNFGTINATNGSPIISTIAQIPNPTNFSGNSFGFSVNAANGLWGINGAGTTNNGLIPTGSWIQAGLNTDALSLTSLTGPTLLGVTGIGGYWFRSDFNGDFVSNSLVNVVVNYAGGSYTNTVTPSGLGNTFFGILVGTNITSVQVTGADGNYSTLANVSVVPEPSTYALLALTAAGLAGYVIRRRRS